VVVEVEEEVIVVVVGQGSRGVEKRESGTVIERDRD
jgi:hypothetical protein